MEKDEATSLLIRSWWQTNIQSHESSPKGNNEHIGCTHLVWVKSKWQGCGYPQSSQAGKPLHSMCYDFFIATYVEIPVLIFLGLQKLSPHGKLQGHMIKAQLHTKVWKRSKMLTVRTQWPSLVSPSLKEYKQSTNSAGGSSFLSRHSWS